MSPRDQDTVVDKHPTWPGIHHTTITHRVPVYKIMQGMYVYIYTYIYVHIYIHRYMCIYVSSKVGARKGEYHNFRPGLV